MTVARPASPRRAADLRRHASSLVGDRPGLIGGIVLSGAIAGICESAILALLASLASALVAGKAKDTLTLGPVKLDYTLGHVLLVALAFALVRLIIQAPVSYFPARICADIQARLRMRLFTAFRKAPWAVKAADGEGSFQELATDQVYQATQGVLNATSAVSVSVMLFVMVGAAMVVDFTTALVVIAAGIALFFAFRPMNRIARRQAGGLSSAQISYAGAIYDAVNMAEEAQVFGTGESEEQKLNDLVETARLKYFRAQYIGRMVPGIYQCLVYLFLVGGIAALIAVGGNGVSSAGTVIILLVRASSFGQSLQGAWVGMYQGLPFLDRISDAERVYRSEPVVSGSARPPGIPKLEFRSVSYAYRSGSPVLRNISFEILPGEAIGLVGPTGAGKSTLTQILLGLRRADVGEYVAGGELVQDWDPRRWTHIFAYVPQEPRLLQGTVADNIRFYRDISDENVEQAARLAHIHDEIDQFSDGYLTAVSQRARAVSGGQRQRLCLARALAGKPAVLILDEPTSQLDARSENLVQESLREVKGELTMFIVSHRLSTLALCDRVMVLRAGTLEAFAPIAELRSSNSFYRAAAGLSGGPVDDDVLVATGVSPIPFRFDIAHPKDSEA